MCLGIVTTAYRMNFQVKNKLLEWLMGFIFRINHVSRPKYFSPFPDALVLYACPNAGLCRSRGRSQSSLRPNTDLLSLANFPVVFIPLFRLLRPHHPKTRTGTPARPHTHHLRSPTPRPACVSCLELPRGGFRLISIEINQQCSFQDHYASGLQAALDIGGGGSTNSGRVRVSFEPPPA